ncbi:hypothetical protein Tco_1070879 [Tanacetum coccineum]|uniref:Reverse transcriptase domain-containing protein n=1 Tax=Tanacetum coccineum TaxID=301880 RepID=A0ABQ5HMQ9_9ASTR
MPRWKCLKIIEAVQGFVKQRAKSVCFQGKIRIHHPSCSSDVAELRILSERIALRQRTKLCSSSSCLHLVRTLPGNTVTTPREELKGYHYPKRFAISKDLPIPTIFQYEANTREYPQEVLGLTDIIASGNSLRDYDPIEAYFLHLPLTPFGDTYNPFYYDPEGDILILEAILNSEPPLPPPSQGTNPTYLPEVRTELKVCETNTANSSIDEPTELDVEEKSALIKVLKSHKRALAWKLSDIQGINPEFCTHKILMEEDYAPAVQHQRRVNPKIHDVIKKEVEKLLEAGLIYPISDSPWVSPVHLYQKKGGMDCGSERGTMIFDSNSFCVTRMRVSYPHHEQNHSAYGTIRLKYLFGKKGCQGEIAPMGSPPPRNLTSRSLILSRALQNLAADHTVQIGKPLATMDPPGGHHGAKPHSQKDRLTPVSSGPPSIKMPSGSLSRTETRGQRQENTSQRAEMLKTPSKFVKSLTYGASTLWACSRLHEGTRSGYHQKDRKPSQNDKTEHVNGKTVRIKAKSKMPKSKSILNNLHQTVARTEEYY